MFGNKKVTVSFAFATGFYSGLLPWMPGTWASGIATIIFFVLPMTSILMQLSITGVLFFVGMVSVDHVLKKTQDQDPSWIVIDEWWGMSIALLGLPKMMSVYVIAFILFRLFDIIKIFPINQLQRLPGSLGVMIDDGAAGIFALIGTHIFLLVTKIDIFLN